MRIEYIRLSREGSTPIFKVWDRESCMFEEHNKNGSWSSWSAFVSDLKANLSSQGIEFGGRYHEEGDDILHLYTTAAPPYIRNLGKPAPPPPSRGRVLMGNAGVWITLLVVASFLVYAVWSQAIRPALGSLGWIEYKTTAQERYERFLADAATCKESKKVVSEKNLRVPALHIYVCSNGEEKVWVYGLEKATKSANGKWVLE